MSTVIQPSLFDAPAAQAAAERGMEQAERNADADWRWAMEQAIRQLAASGRHFSADDARRIAGDPPIGTHPNSAGAVFNRMARQGVIRMVGYTRSARVVGRGNTVREWVGRGSR